MTTPTIPADAPVETKVAEKRYSTTSKQFFQGLGFPIDSEFPMDAVDAYVEKMRKEALERDVGATRDEKPPDLRF